MDIASAPNSFSPKSTCGCRNQNKITEMEKRGKEKGEGQCIVGAVTA